jgi:predicted Fe-Mo cluster-binding NifX family protein
MKIAVSSAGGSIHSPVEERFGRAPYYVIVDSENVDFENLKFGLVSNPSVTSEHGAGPQTATMLQERGANVVLTGRAGPNARRALDAMGITVVEGVHGTVKEVVESYLKGSVKP